MKIERALISVSDKTGLVEFAKALSKLGIEIISTGGTAKALRDAKIPVKDVSAVTSFPEILDGRVKTLHPQIHAGLLFRRDSKEHKAAMKKHNLLPIDLACINLYPFEKTVAEKDVTEDEAIKNIDVGGLAMIRGAAKNYEFVTVVTAPADYARVIENIKKNRGDTSQALKRELAQKAFARTAEYDAAIASYLAESFTDARDCVPPLRSHDYKEGISLRYGENPHQKATFYKDKSSAANGVGHAEFLHGKEMSYNNYLDADAALETAREFYDQPAVVVVKHGNPCGCATGKTLAAAFEAAWAGDPVSAFGSVIAISARVDLATAQLLQDRFVEVIIAPDYDADALDFLRKKSKSLRILKLHAPLAEPKSVQTLRSVGGGILAQDQDVGLVEQWKSVTTVPFPDKKKELALFGIRVCKHVKSNAIVIVREYEPSQFSLLGMGAGQPNRVDSLRKLALTKAHENVTLFNQGQPLEKFFKLVMHECVLVSDAFFPFADNIYHAAQAGIRYVVEPGGSKKDAEVIETCNQYEMAMVFTGMRHFKH